MARTKQEFQTIRSEGGLLPADLLRRVVDPKAKLPGTNPEDYGLPQGERINETITQSWNRLRRHWAEFRSAAQSLPQNEPGTGLTNDKWTLPLLRELGFGFLATSPGPTIDGRTYAINRFFGPTAIHLVGCGLSLDRRAAGVRGAAASNPHGLVQEFLNRSQGHLWAIVSNGLRFRVLRDNQALSRQSFLEFDLEAIFTGEVFPDFVLLWLMAHATRFAPREETRPESCWLEQWTKLADEEGTRALGDLRAGVEKALQILGEAFVSHPRNTALREALRNESLTLSNFHGQLLRLVYRLIFLFVAEDRTLDGVSLLHPRDDSDSARLARERYAAHYSTSRLRDLAGKIKGSRHGDLWQQFNLLVGALSGDSRFDAAHQQLALPVLGSFLWSPASTAHLNAASLTADGTGIELANADFLEALRHLAFTRQGKVLRPVDYKNLGAEELGGVYESLLALTPQISGDGNRFTFAEFAGNERKTSGSYYTPDSLVQCLLDSALDPVVEEAIKGKSGPDAEQAILALKVCDPAVGSGHFLVGAAHRLARHLARVRANMQGESEPSPLLYQHALRDVIGRCLYGVDINPMSAELCRVSLWLEALEPGKPLSFLEHHIQVGNSLLGTTPALLAQGIPDAAFTPIEGDVKTRVTALKKQNKKEREEYAKRQGYLFEPPLKLGNLAAELARIDAAPDDTPEGIAEKERRYAEFVKGSGYQYGRLLADTWCAAFVWKKDDSELGKLCPTERDFRKVESHAAAGLLPHVKDEVQRLAGPPGKGGYQFFHWHLAFPDVFRLAGQDETLENEHTGWSGGFDVVLGNPPWERIQVEALKFFAGTHPHLLALKRSDRQHAIDDLQRSDPSLFAKWEAQRRSDLSTTAFLKSTGRYPLSTQKNINSYAVFLELGIAVVTPNGTCGMITQSGIATDDIMKDFFQYLMSSKRLARFYDFENREGIFPAIDSRMKFCLLTSTGANNAVESPAFIFYATRPDHLRERDREFTLSSDEIRELNPNTLTCPIFRSRRAATLALSIYRRFPVLVRDTPPVNSWSIDIRRMFDMAYDSHLFRSSAQLNGQGFAEGLYNELRNSDERWLRLYEAKLMHHFDHRFATFSDEDSRELSATEKNNPQTTVLPRYWVSDKDFRRKMTSTKWARQWIVAAREITNTTNERTSIFTVLPESGVGHTCYTFTFETSVPATIGCFIGNTNSLTFDWIARQKVAGTHLSVFILKQLPILPPAAYTAPCPWSCPQPLAITHQQFLLPRVLELTYTAWDLEPFARDCGCDGPPFRWDEERRFLLRAELDAAFFHLYLPSDAHGDWLPAANESPEDLAQLKESFPQPRDAVAYIMDTFPIVRRKDEEKYNGDYRTKRVIVEIYDEMQEALRTGHPYQTRLDPPPADPRVAHPDTRVRAAVAEQLIQSGRIAAYVVMLLREWNRPAARNVLEASLVLMLNDSVRQQILNQSLAGNVARSTASAGDFIRGFDGFLQQLQATGFIHVETVRGQQAIQLGPQAPATDSAPDEARVRLRETLQALEAVGEDRARDILQEMMMEPYAVVP